MELSPKSHDINANNEQQRNKRKQFVPQQHGSLSNGGSQCNGEIDVVSEDTADCTEEMSKPSGSQRS
ncbi:hypothetical protein EB796_018418 [Bugula neritina]|uniref:Uncharacterized protein n=1 Tax=Bugula neritina TaxID=10212 RepID=A0A7J7JAK4_BUGNE|nr:hypothetical protein EB796_018418 [Bugula neritina]